MKILEVLAKTLFRGQNVFITGVAVESIWELHAILLLWAPISPFAVATYKSWRRPLMNCEQLVPKCYQFARTCATLRQ